MTAEEESGQTKQEQDEVRHRASILGLYGDESQSAVGEPNFGEPQAHWEDILRARTMREHSDPDNLRRQAKKLFSREPAHQAATAAYNARVVQSLPAFAIGPSSSVSRPAAMAVEYS